MNYKRYIAAALIASLLLAGCGGKEESALSEPTPVPTAAVTEAAPTAKPTVSPAAEVTQEPVEEEEVLPAGMVRSYLTG